MPRQRWTRKTCSSAARQWTAWLSPTSATVATARALLTPKAQREGGTTDFTGVHRALGSSSASSGVGVTLRSRAGFTHGLPGARDAAPKQRGVAAFAVAVSAANKV